MDGSYILPPIQHHDGKFYMKIGHHGTFEQPVSDKQQLEQWYQGISDWSGHQKYLLSIISRLRNHPQASWFILVTYPDPLAIESEAGNMSHSILASFLYKIRICRVN